MAIATQLAKNSSSVTHRRSWKPEHAVARSSRKIQVATNLFPPQNERRKLLQTCRQWFPWLEMPNMFGFGYLGRLNTTRRQNGPILRGIQHNCQHHVSDESEQQQAPCRQGSSLEGQDCSHRRGQGQQNTAASKTPTRPNHLVILIAKWGQGNSKPPPRGGPPEELTSRP